MTPAFATARSFHPGMGRAVAERTILRPGEDWGDVADRVSYGNSLLHPSGKADLADFRNHLRTATILMSGRHLQHGDAQQPSRNLEVFSNCSTSAASFLLFYLLLNGSGVGRSYDDDMMVVNWDDMPTVRCVLDEAHPDFEFGADESLRDAQHKYGTGENVHWFKVPDSREGWGQAIELMETMAFQKAFRDELLVLDFSGVRGKGSPIGGMQNRPSSGPKPMMAALHKIATLKGAGLPRWKQAMYVDHYLAEPVLVGGARRAARMAVKWWRDKSCLEFITVKRPLELQGLDLEGIVARKAEGNLPFPFLWSSNNSIGVDKDFWRRLALQPGEPGYNSEMTRHARAVHKLATECAYADGTGEPGYLNLDMLTQKGEPPESIGVGSKRYQVRDETQFLLTAIAKRAAKKPHWTIVNPCGEIPLALYGGYCVIADNVPFHAESFEEILDAGAHSARALIRVNLMDNLYAKETARTNRIGVGQTGVHEFAWKFFKVGFRDLVTPDFEAYHQLASTYTPFVDPLQPIRDLAGSAEAGIRAAAFWEFQGHYGRTVIRSAFAYADSIGVVRPHTVTTIKPAGTTSKLFGLSEGWHLPALAWMIRWVQFRNDSPLVAEYKAKGYPTRELTTYQGTTIAGFPTEPTIAGLGMGDELVLAGQANPEDQYKWLKFGEYFWIEGGSVAEYVAGLEARDGEERHGGQISYTLKYSYNDTSYDDFQKTLTENQSAVRACSVMPQTDADGAIYEYLPEEPVTKAEYERIARTISETTVEEIDESTLQCAGGACPVDIGPRKVA
jgi:adenosylcobalamin-dependent ribonucleoside-triphosphate reductase